jgi:hypothetical protein
VGAPIFFAYLLVILTIAFIGAIIGGVVSEGAPEATKLGGIVGLFFGIAIVIAEIFP